MRAASSTDQTSSQEPASIQPPSRSRSLSVSSQVPGPPPKRFKTLASVPSSSSHKPLSSSQSIRDEREAEEDVRRMESETDQLRRKSRASEDTVGFANPPFPLQASGTKRRTSPGYTDTTQPVNVLETPKQNRNKGLRENGSINGRRSSNGSRGKRVSTSYEASGIICASHSTHSSPRPPTECTELYTHSSAPQFRPRFHAVQTYRSRSARITASKATSRVVRAQSFGHTHIQLNTLDSAGEGSTTKT